MKIFKRISWFFDRLNHDIRLFNAKASLICGGLTLALGLISWIIGGRADKVMMLYIFPRSALSLGIMYLLWAISLFFIGIIIGGVAFGCEKFKKRETTKILIFLLFSYLFTLCVYPIFFKCLSPFIAFIVILIALAFCFFALCASIRIFSLWSMLIILHMLWLFYNGFLAFAISLIN